MPQEWYWILLDAWRIHTWERKIIRSFTSWSHLYLFWGQHDGVTWGVFWRIAEKNKTKTKQSKKKTKRGMRMNGIETMRLTKSACFRLLVPEAHALPVWEKLHSLRAWNTKNSTSRRQQRNKTWDETEPEDWWQLEALHMCTCLLRPFDNDWVELHYLVEWDVQQQLLIHVALKHQTVIFSVALRDKSMTDMFLVRIQVGKEEIWEDWPSNCVLSVRC